MKRRIIQYDENEHATFKKFVNDVIMEFENKKIKD